MIRINNTKVNFLFIVIKFYYINETNKDLKMVYKFFDILNKQIEEKLVNITKFDLFVMRLTSTLFGEFLGGGGVIAGYSCIYGRLA